MRGSKNEDYPNRRRISVKNGAPGEVLNETFE